MVRMKKIHWHTDWQWCAAINLILRLSQRCKSNWKVGEALCEEVKKRKVHLVIGCLSHRVCRWKQTTHLIQDESPAASQDDTSRYACLLTSQTFQNSTRWLPVREDYVVIMWISLRGRWSETAPHQDSACVYASLRTGATDWLGRNSSGHGNGVKVRLCVCVCVRDVHSCGW